MQSCTHQKNTQKQQVLFKEKVDFAKLYGSTLKTFLATPPKKITKSDGENKQIRGELKKSPQEKMTKPVAGGEMKKSRCQLPSRKLGKKVLTQEPIKRKAKV